MKIAYLSNYKEVSGYSYAARGYIDALTHIDENVVAKNVSLIGGGTEKDTSNLNDVDITIQHTLPDFFQRVRSKNIGLFAWETNKLPNEWIEKINLYTDAIIVPNEEEKDCFSKQVNVPVYCVPHCIDIKVDLSKKTRIGGNLVNNDTHLFYSITSDSSRKNLSAIIAAYLTEFREGENCFLFLQVNGQKDAVIRKIEDIKRGYKLDNYPRIFLNSTILPEEEIMAIHNTFDTYIALSHGESFNIPACTAAIFGKNLVLTPCGGHKMYANDFVNSQLTPCFGCMEQPQHLYKGNGLWYNCEIMSAREHMRKCFYKGKVTTSIEDTLAIKFSKKEVGNKLANVCKEVLS